MSNTTNKENNKNAANNTSIMQKKRFMGGNSSLQGKTFEITSKDSVHYFAETVKAIADYVGQEYTHGGDIRYMKQFCQTTGPIQKCKSIQSRVLEEAA